MANDLDKPKTAKPQRRQPPQATLDWADDGVLNITMEGDWKTIAQACVHRTVSSGLLSDAAILGSQGKRCDAEATDFVLGFVDAMKPRDAAEALLLTQMATTHQVAMQVARHLIHVETIPQKDCAERAFNKTTRTFAAQMDTLKRYRSKGQQTVRVERVTVEPGGQAIVGNVETGGRGSDES